MKEALSEVVDQWTTIVFDPERARWRKRIVAGGASLFFHLALFLAIAMVSDLAPSDELLMRDPDEDKPLEVVFATPPSPEAAALPAPTPTAPAAPAETHLLDPENLKVSEAPPAEAKLLASQHSEGTATPAPAPAPQMRAEIEKSADATEPTADLTVSTAATTPKETATVAAIGVWKKAVANAIGLRWDHHRKNRADALAVGSVRITFRIDAKGKVSEVNVLSNSGNPNNALLAVRSAREAQIPPIPSERLSKLPGGRVEVELTLTILPHS